MARAAERGGEADYPSEVSALGWRDILLRVWQEIGTDNISMIAAGVAFYGLLAIFPAITALVSIWGLVADPAQVQQQFAQSGRSFRRTHGGCLTTSCGRWPRAVRGRSAGA
jgi:membrane protein